MGGALVVLYGTCTCKSKSYYSEVVARYQKLTYSSGRLRETLVIRGSVWVADQNAEGRRDQVHTCSIHVVIMIGQCTHYESMKTELHETEQ